MTQTDCGAQRAVTVSLQTSSEHMSLSPHKKFMSWGAELVAWGQGGCRALCDRTLTVCLGANEHTTQPYSTDTSILKHPLTAAYITADSPGGGAWDMQQISEQL